MAEGRPYKFTAIAGDATRAVVVVPGDDGRYEVTIDGVVHCVDARATGPGSLSLLVEHAQHEVAYVSRGEHWTVLVDGRPHRLQLLDERARRGPRSAVGPGDKEIRAVMPGKVVAVLVAVGAVVEQGQGVLVIEAMKMENEITAPRAGTVKELRVKPGQAVEAGELLAVVDD